jgi:putative tryptophan/tyrosine transport system substrate-binding protein
MRRRAFLAGIGAAAAVSPHAANAQHARLPVIGYLSSVSSKDDRFLSAFRRKFEQLGYIEGRNCILEVRWAEGRTDVMAQLADELVRLNPSVIVAANTSATTALKRFTSSIPIVSALLTNPIGFGFATSLARPGGNVTGTLITLDTLSGKHLQLARDIKPSVRRVGMLMTSDAALQVRKRDTEAAAGALGIEVVTADVSGAPGLDQAFRMLAKQQAEFVLVQPSTLFTTERRRVAELAINVKLPTISWVREHVEEGGFLSYGSDYQDNYQRAAVYVDKILKGERVSELPIEFPTKFELVVNLKTAKAIGIGLSEAFLLRADQVIE